MNKFEKLIEYIINDEDQKARELFHDIVVEKSRDIYESIMDEESMDHVHGAQVEDLTNELQDEEAMGEDEFSLGGDMDDDGDMDGDLPADDDMGPVDDDTAEHNEIEDKVMYIDAKLDELLAKFDDIMGNDDDFGPSNDSGLDGEMNSDEFAPEEEPEEEPMAEAKGSGNPFAKGSGTSGSAASGKSGMSGKSGSGKMESRKMSTTELMREYVDKIQDMNLTGASEGDAVGATGKKTAVNDKSITGPGADFGGQTASPKGGAQNQDGTSPTKANNEYNKGQGTIKSGNVNVPGGKAGAPKTTGHEYTKDAKGAEGQTTSGSVPVNDKSVQKQNTGKK